MKHGHKSSIIGAGVIRSTVSRTATRHAPSYSGVGCLPRRAPAPPIDMPTTKPEWRGGPRPDYYRALLHMNDERAGDWKPR